MSVVFLGGTCNDSTWRETLISQLEVSYFNPVVEDWTEECMAEELRQREISNFCLYVITADMTGVYSIAEAIDDSNKRPDKTIFSFVEDGFNRHQIKSLMQVAKMVKSNGGHTMQFDEIANFLNHTEGL